MSLLFSSRSRANKGAFLRRTHTSRGQRQPTTKSDKLSRTQSRQEPIPACGVRVLLSCGLMSCPSDFPRSAVVCIRITTIRYGGYYVATRLPDSNHEILYARQYGLI